MRDAEELHDALLTLDRAASWMRRDASGGALPRASRCANRSRRGGNYCDALAAAAARGPRAFVGERGVLGGGGAREDVRADFSRARDSSRRCPKWAKRRASREDAHLRAGHRMDGAQRPGDAEASWAMLLGIATAGNRARLCCGSKRAARFCAASSPARHRGNRVVRPAFARAHSPADGRHAAQTNRAGESGAIHALAAALAARGAGTQLLGERGTLEALQQLQGFEAPANAWERQILARRVADYDPKVLDHLSLTGAVGWGRLSPHPATLETADGERRRVVPTSVAPITFFVREDADWMIPRREPGDEETRGLSPAAIAVLQFLRQRGASFFADIVRGTGKLKAEVETALWELVAAGLLTADGFDNLRALIDPKRRSGQGSGRSARPRHSAGRWSLLYPGEAVGSQAGARVDLLDAAAPLWRGVPRSARARDDSARSGARC